MYLRFTARFGEADSLEDYHIPGLGKGRIKPTVIKSGGESLAKKAAQIWNYQEGKYNPFSS
jgi:hypothetical protein